MGGEEQLEEGGADIEEGMGCEGVGAGKETPVEQDNILIDLGNGKNVTGRLTLSDATSMDLSTPTTVTISALAMPAADATTGRRSANPVDSTNGVNAKTSPTANSGGRDGVSTTPTAAGRAPERQEGGGKSLATNSINTNSRGSDGGTTATTGVGAAPDRDNARDSSANSNDSTRAVSATTSPTAHSRGRDGVATAPTVAGLVPAPEEAGGSDASRKRSLSALGTLLPGIRQEEHGDPARPTVRQRVTAASHSAGTLNFETSTSFNTPSALSAARDAMEFEKRAVTASRPTLRRTSAQGRKLRNKLPKSRINSNNTAGNSAGNGTLASASATRESRTFAPEGEIGWNQRLLHEQKCRRSGCDDAGPLKQHGVCLLVCACQRQKAHH